MFTAMSARTLPLDLLEARFAELMVTLDDGAKVAVRQCGSRSVDGCGDAPVFVLLHGIGSGAASWLHCALAITEMLDRPCRVIAWDAPGYGTSSALDAPAPSADDYAGRLHQALQALGVSRCVLVGHSLGALMATGYAKRYGSAAVSNLVLFSPAGGYGAPDRASDRAHARRRRLDELHRLGIAGMARNAALRLLSATADAAARDWVEWNASRLNAEGYLQAVELLCNADLARSISLEVPVAVYCGDADVVTPPAVCRSWAARFAAPFALIADAGHACPVEQPEAVACAIASASGASDGAKAFAEMTPSAMDQALR